MSNYSLLAIKGRFRIQLIFQGILVGAAAGFASVCFRLLIDWAEAFSMAVFAGGYALPLWAMVPLWSGVAVLIGRLMEWEPMAAGGGVPQVEGELLGRVSMSWWRVLLVKFIGGGAAVALGMSLGRAGTSVHIGAAAGKGVASLQKKAKIEERLFISSGAAAGLSAVFNAPLAGVIFALEEIHKNLSPLLFLSAMVASLTADFLSKGFFGLGPLFVFSLPGTLPLSHYGWLVLLGVVCGLGGTGFSKLILAAQFLYNGLPFLLRYRLIIPALGVLIVGPLFPAVLGGGQFLVERLGREGLSMGALGVLFCVKMAFTALCFSSGVAGGIFLPMLSLGAALGALFGTAAAQFAGVDPAFGVNFLILAMAGFFAAVVRAPITAIILITEITGSLSHMLSVSVVAIAAHVTADLLAARPIYEALLLRLLGKRVGIEGAGKVLLEGTVGPGSFLDGKRIHEASLPEGCLLVSVQRAGGEILPGGETLLTAGDRITALADGGQAPAIRERLLEMTGAHEPEDHLWE